MMINFPGYNVTLHSRDGISTANSRYLVTSKANDVRSEKRFI